MIKGRVENVNSSLNSLKRQIYRGTIIGGYLWGIVAFSL